MAYTDLLQEEGINAQFLAVLKPRRKVDGFTIVGGNTYRTDFSFGQIISVTVNGVELGEAASSTLSDSEWFYDVDIERLFIFQPGGGDPSSSFVVATYEIYVGTFDAHINRIPTDATSRVVYFEPVIVNSPTINQLLDDSLTGFLPVTASRITLSNLTNIFEPHIHESSFNKAEIDLYHWLGDLEASNIKLVFRGRMGSLRYTQETLDIEMLDPFDILDQNWRNYQETNPQSFYNETLFPDLNPAFVGKPIRAVFGRVDGFIPVNIDYDATNPTTSNNRAWAVGQIGGTEVALVQGSPAPTTTRTYLDSVQGFDVQDFARFNTPAETVEITAIDRTANFIDHEALSVAAGVGTLVARRAISKITLLVDGIKYFPKYIRDWTETTIAGGAGNGFTFTSSMESNLSIPRTINTTDIVYLRVYGKGASGQIGGFPFEDPSPSLVTMTNPVNIIFEILQKGLLIPDDNIDTATFEALEPLVELEVGFAVPDRSWEQLPTFKNVLARILESSLLRMYLNNDNKWTIAQVAPIGSIDKTIEDTEILRNSFRYDYNYNDVLSDVFVEYAFREVSDDVSLTVTETRRTASAISNTARYLHNIKRQKTFQSLLLFQEGADYLSDRLAFIFGERKGRLSLSAKGRFFEGLVGDVIQVNRTKLPGFEFDDSIERTRSLTIVDITKGLQSIDMVLDDQKGIEDNSGSW